MALVHRVTNVLGMVLRPRNLVENLETRDAGQGLVEYALILVLVAVAAVSTLGFLGAAVGGVMTTITGSL